MRPKQQLVFKAEPNIWDIVGGCGSEKQTNGSTTTIIDKFLDIFEQLDTFVIVVPEDNVGDACLADNNPNKSAREY